ncbi:LOW QUALITY PROTEIN: hypothetical protein Cgig2_025833 [Carnegiea gigantea]|uniref:Uncharacterized protein n=1 Tax=Carnegiea gigantea TaxID=171969 RepID=A0A9Q1GIS2_9CARY|nr:LOW QUALITY PROTEIN: hypothetical protein Cgig2_025833 [Carnegiea gigantea]
MDTLKGLMSTVADTITRQVSEQVKKAMDAASSFRLMEHGRVVARSDRSDRLPLDQQRGRAAEEPVARSAQGKIAISATASTPYAGNPMLRRPPPMTAPPRPQNARKYCEFHEQSGHTTTELRFGDKNKFKSPEVDFLLMTHCLQCNHWATHPPPSEGCGGPNKITQHNLLQPFPKPEAKTGTSKIGGRGVHVGLSAILALFLLRCTGLSFQGVGGLVLSSFTLR